jgi:hypothetical protein
VIALLAGDSRGEVVGVDVTGGPPLRNRDRLAFFVSFTDVEPRQDLAAREPFPQPLGGVLADHASEGGTYCGTAASGGKDRQDHGRSVEANCRPASNRDSLEKKVKRGASGSSFISSMRR